MRLKNHSLTVRFLVAQLTVLLLGLTVAAVVAVLAGPPLFHEHLEMAGISGPSAELFHVEQAYRDANLIVLTVALVTALVCVLIASVVLSRTIRKPLEQLTNAATEVARGRWHIRVPVRGNGIELNTLANSFNTMASRLDNTEQTRRRLLSDLAHEMRTPVSVLSAYTEGLEDHVLTWDTSTSAVMTQQVSRLTRLVSDLDLVSRIEEHQIELDISTFELIDFIEHSVTTFYQQYAAKQVQLDVNNRINEITVRADPQRLAQVIDNLLSNALRHTPPGGVVRIETYQTLRKSISIRFIDNGDGMTPEQLEHAFTRFYRSDDARARDHGGAGIGLTVSRALIDAHGGTLTAASDGLNQGSTFTIDLPTFGVSGTNQAGK